MEDSNKFNTFGPGDFQDEERPGVSRETSAITVSVDEHPLGGAETLAEEQDVPEVAVVPSEEQLQASYEAGLAEGYERGRQEAEESAERRASQVREEAANLVKSLELSRIIIPPQTDHVLIDFVQDLCRHFYRDQVLVKPEVLAGLVEQGMQTVRSSHPVSIRVSANETEQSVSLLRDAIGDRGEVVSDAGLDVGDFVLFTDEGSVHAKLSERLASLFQD
ncbi:FliH/SctL family protein [Ferrimonas marina]|uniref:Flagellar assembly protein FliH n=1 Tax=Ferrimonas marina TaxID=299255 RepID=A0A1M5TFL8_9GAMM|nr:FliH/SctL family protein [Ferrimonas marina]SHH49615.1 Flagellar biosynthesis/type III secretory pathway protein FliH [Ferrimonas marina]